MNGNVRATSIGIGGNAFGWRLPGVLLGVLGAALLYLLARVLFARRSIALIVAVLRRRPGATADDISVLKG